jgi:hypothetical protein
MTTSPDEPVPKRRTWLRWPPEAVRIAKTNKPPVVLCEELAALSGRDKRACWRFLKKYGVVSPGSRARRKFDPRTINTVIDYVSEHGVRAASVRFGYDSKTLYNLLYRQDHTKLSKDSLSLRQVCAHLGVKYTKAMNWIELDLLEAERMESKAGAVSYQVEFAALQKFCKEHRSLLVTRRSSPSRIRFLEEYVFAPKHAELLRTRESKREAEAYERGEYLEAPERSQRSG